MFSGNWPVPPPLGEDEDWGPVAARPALGLAQEDPEARNLVTPLCGQDGGIRFFENSKNSG